MKNLLVVLLVLGVVLTAGLASAYTVPQESDLLFGLDTDYLVPVGNTGPWAAVAPASSVFNTIGTPTADPTGTTPVIWEKNTANGTGYYNNWTWTSPVPVNGVTAIAAVRPVRARNDRNWTPIIDVLFGAFRLGVRNDTGVIILTRSNPAGTQTQVNSTYTIPEGQATVISAVVQADGSFVVYANGTSVFTGGALTGGVTSLVNGTRRLVCIGTSQDDQSATFNGNIGDVYMWKTALPDAARIALENDLMAKFHAGASYPANTITASSTGTGGSISPTGAVTVPYEFDKTFTITKNYGYSANVVVDGTSQGDVPSYAFNDVTSAHTIAVAFSTIPTRTISGHVTAAAAGGATVSVRMTAGGLPAQQATTDASGNYTMTVPEGAYYICASQTGYLISAEVVSNTTGNQTIDFTLTQKTHLNGVARNIPKMENLLFAADTTDMGAESTSGAWPLLYCTYPGVTSLTAITSPTVTKVRGLKYDYNLRADGDGYRLNTSIITAPIPTNGCSVVALIKPVRNTTSDGFNSLVDVFYSNLILGVKNNTGQIQVRRNGTDYWSTNDAAHTIPDGQITILSLSLQPDGTFSVWASAWNGTTKSFGAPTLMMSSTVVSSFTAFVPSQNGPEDFKKWINVGRNNPDGWSTFNGYVGDIFVYKAALSDTDRATLEADLNTKMNSIATYNITATAGANGSVSPAGVTAVGEGDSQIYTITPNFGYNVADVKVDNASQGAITTYTFTSVTAAHTIDATFAAKPTYAITGKVIDAGTSAGVPGATVFVSTASNASVTPAYTATTDSAGNYTVQLFDGAWYLCAAKAGYFTSGDITVTVAGGPVGGQDILLTSSGRNIPQMDKLVFAALSQQLTPNGATTNPWPTYHPAGVQMAIMGAPTVVTDGGVQWESQAYAGGNGYRYGYFTSPIPINGATAVAVINPQGNGTDGGNWTSVIDVMYSRLVVGIRGTDGLLRVCRNGEWKDGPVLANGEKKIITMNVQPDGKYKVYVNGLQVMDITSTSAMTAFDPYWNAGGLGFWSYINVGRNQPDGWTTYSGKIGDVLLYKTALSPTDRIQLENDLASHFSITGLPVYHYITATAGTGGAIDPSGVVPVVDATDQTFNITANPGYAVQDIKVDNVSKGAVATYTFPTVTADHTIAATFRVLPNYTVSGKVTNKKTGAAIAGATVYFSQTANASVSPYATATTDSAGNYSKSIPEGSWYVAAGATDYYTSADTTLNLLGNTIGVNFALASTIRDIPRQSDLWFGVVTDSLPASGNTGPWPTYFPTGQTLTPIATPAVEMVDGLKWAQISRMDGDGYTQAPYAEPVAVNGVTIIAAVRPVWVAVTGEPRGEIVDIFYNRLALAVAHADGRIMVCNRRWADYGPAIPDGQKTILSLTVLPDGTYSVYANGFQVMAGTTADGMTSLSPLSDTGTTGFWSYVNVGRNQPDGWSAFNGNIGDVFVYKVALNDNERIQAEKDLASKFSIALPVYISGKVVLTDGTTPVAGATITGTGLDTYTATTGPDGTYSMGVVPNTTYTVGAAKTGYTTITPDQTVVVGAGDVTGVNFTLGAPPEVKGRILKPDNTPLYNACVQLNGFGGPAVITDSTGSYDIIGGLPEGAVELYADALGYAAHTQDVVVPLYGAVVVPDIKLSAAPAENFNSTFEANLNGWEAVSYTPAGTDALGNPFPVVPDMYTLTRVTTENTTPGGTASAAITANQMPSTLPVWYSTLLTSGSVTFMDGQILNDWYHVDTWTVDQFVGKTLFLTPALGGPVKTFNITANDAYSITLDGDVSSIASGDLYSVRNIVYQSWYFGGARLAGGSIPVDMGATYNVYFKTRGTGTANRFFVLSFKDIDGNELKGTTLIPWAGWGPFASWTQVLNGRAVDNTDNSLPMLRITPPEGTTTVDLLMGFTDGNNAAWLGSVQYIDDFVFDKVGGTPVATPVSKISELKALADGTVVEITGKNVSAITGGGVPTGVFYIEETDRSSAVRINWVDFVLRYDAATITGVLHKPATGEMYIDASSVMTAAGATVKPVYTTTTTLAGKILDGMLVRVAGKVGTVGADYFTVIDGGVETKVLCGGAPGVTAGTFVSLTGIASYDGTSRAVLRIP